MAMDDNFTRPQPQYGEGARLAALISEAPISGAPAPPVAAPGAMPVPAVAPVPSPGLPSPGQGIADPRVEYYRSVAKVWRKLARQPDASPVTKRMASEATSYAKRMMRGDV